MACADLPLGTGRFNREPGLIMVPGFALWRKSDHHIRCVAAIQVKSDRPKPRCSKTT
jgi:hypothetical protein